MKIGIFVWNIKNDYTNGRIAIDDSKGAMSVALMKVHDGLEWQTYSPEDSAQWANGVFRPQGIDWMPWGVARGWSLDVAHREGALAGQHAAASGSEYILDLEPYKEDYWQGISGTPAAFCAGYASTSNGIKLRLCPDARNVGINLEEWVQETIVSIWHPQAYYTLFQQPLEVGVAVACNPLFKVGIPRARIIPVMPLSGVGAGDPSISPDDLERDARYLHDQGFPGLAYWRRGVMSAQQVERLLSMDDPWAPVPAPPEPQPDYADVVARAQVIVNQAQAIIAEVGK